MKKRGKNMDFKDKVALITGASRGIGASIAYDLASHNCNICINYNNSYKEANDLKENKKGKIFVMSSLSSMTPIFLLGSYTSTKSAISSLTIALHQELKLIKSKISISLIEPGAYYTGFNQVMIDNKEKYLNKNSIFYQKRYLLTKYQKIIFKILEKRKLDSIVNKIVKEVESNKPKFHIRAPISQLILTKIYLLLFR